MPPRQHAHLEFKHGKVVANTHAAARAKWDERARLVALLTKPPANIAARSGDAVHYNTGFVQDLLSLQLRLRLDSCRRSTSQKLD